MASVKTSRAKIAEYWLGSEEGRARYPSNPACSECHWDAPDVGDPSYMLKWMARRKSKFARIGPLIEEAVQAAGLNDELERLLRRASAITSGGLQF